MKKILFSMLIIASCFGVANAQLIVDEKGRTAIGYEGTDTLKSKFSINDVGLTNTTAYLRSYEEGVNGLYIYGKPKDY